MSHETSPDLGNLLHRTPKAFHDRFALSAAGERFTYRALGELLEAKQIPVGNGSAPRA